MNATVPLHPLFETPLPEGTSEYYDESASDALRLLYLQIVSGTRQALHLALKPPQIVMLSRTSEKALPAGAKSKRNCRRLESDAAVLWVQQAPFFKYDKLPDRSFLDTLKTICDLWTAHGEPQSKNCAQLRKLVESGVKSESPSIPSILAKFATPLCALPGGMHAAKAGGIVAGLGLLLGLRCCLEVKPRHASNRTLNFYKHLEKFAEHFRHPLFKPLDDFILERIPFDGGVAAPGRFASSKLAADFLNLVESGASSDSKAKKARRKMVRSFLRPLLQALKINPGERFSAERAMTPDKVKFLVQPLLDGASRADHEMANSDLFLKFVKVVQARYTQIVCRASMERNSEDASPAESSFPKVKRIHAIEEFIKQGLHLLDDRNMPPSRSSPALSKSQLEALIQRYIRNWIKGSELKPEQNVHTKGLTSAAARQVLTPFALWLHSKIGEKMWHRLCDQTDLLLFQCSFATRPVNFSLWDELLRMDNLECLLAEETKEASSKVWNNVTVKFLERLDAFTERGMQKGADNPTPPAARAKRRNSRAA